MFGNTFYLININRYNSQYLYLIRSISVNSYNFQGSNLIYENGILVEKKIQS